MRDETLKAYQDMVRRVEDRLDLEARLKVSEPTALRGEMGARYERAGAIWFVGDEHGQPFNHGFHLDQYGPRRLVMEAWGKGYRSTLDISGEPTQTEITRALETLLPPAISPLRTPDVLDSDDWDMIQDAVERAAGLEDERGKRDRLRELSTALLRPATRTLCNQCDGAPADRWLANGQCAHCYLVGQLLERLPGDDFDDDVSGESILENAITEMSMVWLNAKRLREQIESTEAEAPKVKWYLWTQEIRNLMGWMGKENEYFTRFFAPAKAEDKPE